jgi:hypothetical protein
MTTFTADHDLRFGLVGDRMVSIEDVASGLACGAKCAGCGARLVAKKGDVLRHHFAHESDQECAGAHETAVHRLAKQIVADAGGIMLPDLVVSYAQYRKPIFAARWIHLDQVWLEVWRDGIRPDIIGKRLDRLIAIEIMVTHVCDERKIASFQNRSLAAIEIDLSRLPRDADIAEITPAVLREAPREWLFNAKGAAVLHHMKRAARRQQSSPFTAKSWNDAQEGAMEMLGEKQAAAWLRSFAPARLS